ncbi:MAG: DNA-3-methyladenine glycosylase [Cyclobacteriaceae bacterium]|nr:DNA-3-methyladenine glycosylase [Cyclobacteriaceae bacterium]
MGNSFFISVPDTFDFKHCLSFLTRSPREVLHVCDGQEVIKVIRGKDRNILFRVSATSNKRLQVDVLNTSLTRDVRVAVESYVREWFDLETDIGPFYAIASKDKLLKPFVTKYYGYRIVGQPDLFESLVWAVIGQQINLGFAYTLKQRFVENFGEQVEINGTSYYLFPKPGDVVHVSPDDLLQLKFSRQKAKYIIGLAEAFVSGEISREKLEAMTPDERMEALLRLNGIGRWTANYVLMRTFRHPAALPLGDAGLNAALRRLLKLDRKPTLAEVQRVFRRYRGWEAYATLYLWKSL